MNFFFEDSLFTGAIPVDSRMTIVGEGMRVLSGDVRCRLRDGLTLRVSSPLSLSLTTSLKYSNRARRPLLNAETT